MILLFLFIVPTLALWEFSDNQIIQHVPIGPNTLTIIDNYFKHIDLIEQEPVTPAADNDAYPGRRWSLLNKPDNPYIAGQACGFSTMEIPPHVLKGGQKMPHSDGDVDALLIFLHDDEHGGTGFYRHRETGYMNPYDFALEEQIATIKIEFDEPEEGYISGSTDRWEMLYHVPAKRNRAIRYNGLYFHSPYVKNYTHGRRTINCFPSHKWTFEYIAHDFFQQPQSAIRPELYTTSLFYTGITYDDEQ